MPRTTPATSEFDGWDGWLTKQFSHVLVHGEIEWAPLSECWTFTPDEKYNLTANEMRDLAADIDKLPTPYPV